MEYKSKAEIQTLHINQAECKSPNAPAPSPQEKFKAILGGTFDCLAPDFEDYAKNNPDF